jgi:hypothetical protein
MVLAVLLMGDTRVSVFFPAVYNLWKALTVTYKSLTLWISPPVFLAAAPHGSTATNGSSLHLPRPRLYALSPSLAPWAEEHGWWSGKMLYTQNLILQGSKAIISWISPHGDHASCSVRVSLAITECTPKESDDYTSKSYNKPKLQENVIGNITSHYRAFTNCESSQNPIHFN